MSRKVFFTYAHADESEAKAIEAARTLSSMGVRVWLDKEQLKPGDSIKQRTSEAIDQASVVVAFLGAGSGKSKWFTWEIQEALNKGKTVFPVILGEYRADDLPEPLRDKFAIRAKDANESAQLIYDAIEKDRGFWSKLKEYLANG